MMLRILDRLSRGAGPVNEDRCGAAGPLAWVIDGATDVLAAPIVGEMTDAAWFAEELDRALARHALAPPADLFELPARLASEIGTEFRRTARRPPGARHEQPSAAAIVLCAGRDAISVLSLGDCALVAETENGLVEIGIGGPEAGDRWVAASLASHSASAAAATYGEARAALWPKLRAARNLMNMEEGYGIFSITPPPACFVRVEHLPLARGQRVLLASDGLARLVDVFRRYSSASLLDAVLERSLASLVAELRALEQSDAECRMFPRAKVTDDATGMVLEIA